MSDSFEESKNRSAARLAGSFEATVATMARYFGRRAVERWEPQHAVFRGASYVNRDLQQSRVTGCRFEGCNFTESAATGAKWVGNLFFGCSFDRADMEFADMSGCEFRPLESSDGDVPAVPTTLIGAGFNGVSFRGARFDRIRTKGSSFAYADFTSARIYNSDLGGTFEGAVFEKTDMSGVSFLDSNVDFADFTGAEFNKVKLSLLDIPFLFGLDVNLFGDGIDVIAINEDDGSETPVSADQFDGIKETIINFHLGVNNYFCAANMAVLAGDHERAMPIFFSGLELASFSEDFRTIKLLCKLIRKTEDVTGKFGPARLRKFYDLITANVARSTTPGIRNQYQLHDGQIRSYLLNVSSNILRVNFASEAWVAPDANNIIGRIADMISASCELAGISVDIVGAKFSFNSKARNYVDVRIVSISQNIYIGDAEDSRAKSPWNSFTVFQATATIISILIAGFAAVRPLFESKAAPQPSVVIQQKIEQNHIEMKGVIVPDTFSITKDGLPIAAIDNGVVRLFFEDSGHQPPTRLLSAGI